MDTVTITLPDWHAFGWKEWTLLIVSINAIYGYITHVHSLPAIHRWNKKIESIIFDRSLQARQVAGGDLIRHVTVETMLGIFAIRIFLGLPVRILLLIMGLIGVVLMFFATGKFSSRNLLGWHWHMTPKELSKFF